MKFVSSGPRVKEHEAILHMLERTLPGDSPEDPGTFYATDAFADELAVWKDTPLVFGQTHPDLDEFEEDPVAACNNVGANIIGTCTEAWIDNKGHSKLMGSLKMFNPSTVKDENVRKAILLAEKLFNEGKLSPSSAFAAKAAKGDKVNRLMGGIRPNHILLFEESEDGTMPRDPGAGLLNAKPRRLQVQNMPKEPAAPDAGQPQGGIAPGVIDRFKTLLQEMMGILDGKEAPEDETPETATKNSKPPVTPAGAKPAGDDDMVDTELKNQVDKLTKDLDDFKKENATLKKENEDMKKDLDAKKVAEADEIWKNIKANLETGLVDTPEKESAQRKAYEANPGSFTLGMLNTKLKNAGKKDGAGETPPAPSDSVTKYQASKKIANTMIRRGHVGKSGVNK